MIGGILIRHLARGARKKPPGEPVVSFSIHPSHSAYTGSSSSSAGTLKYPKYRAPSASKPTSAPSVFHRYVELKRTVYHIKLLAVALVHARPCHLAVALRRLFGGNAVFGYGVIHFDGEFNLTRALVARGGSLGEGVCAGAKLDKEVAVFVRHGRAYGHVVVVSLGGIIRRSAVSV